MGPLLALSLRTYNCGGRCIIVWARGLSEAASGNLNLSSYAVVDLFRYNLILTLEAQFYCLISNNKGRQNIHA